MDLKIYAKTTARVFAAKKLMLSFLIAMAVTGSMYGQAGSGLNLLKAQKNMVVVPVNSSLNISNNITLEAWINHSDIAGTQDVISKSSNVQNNGYIFPRTSDGWRNVQFYLYINSAWQILTVPYSGPTQTKRNQWHHLAATYDGTYMKIYVDGVQAGSLMVQGSIATNNNVLTIGGQTGYNNEYFGGSVDEVRVWNRALTQCEISAHKDCELTGSETGLAAYYKFNQGLVGLPNLTETTVYDATSNGNNGILNGFLLTGLTSNWTTGAITTGNTCAVFTPVQATASSSAPAVGIGDDIQLFASAGDTYSWTGPNGFTSTEQNPVIPNATLAGTGVYTVVVSSGGCSASASVTVIVTYKGKALTFDGVKDQVRVPNSASLTSNKFTLEAWINPTSATPLVQSVMSKASVVPNNSGYIFPRTDDGWLNCAVWLTIDGSWVSYSVPYPGLNRWTHVAATYDGFNVRIYIDGQLMRDEPVSGTVNFGNNDLIIGNQEGYVWNFAGSMDEMRVWSRALTQCEIQNNMSCEMSGANGALAGASGLSAYFRFNQGLYNVSNASTNTLVDSSGNANNGTLLNFNLSGLVSNWNLGGSVNNSSCLPYQAVLPTAGSNGPIVEVGHPIELTSSEGTSWAWTGPNGFTSTLQNPIINNSTLDMSGVYSVVITGNGCSSTASTKLKVAYRAYSLHFDGVNDQVVVPNAASLNMSSQITLEAWVYPTDSTRLIQDVMSKSTKSVNNGYIFPRTDDGWKHYTFYLHLNGAWQKLTAAYPSLNEWHHLAATYDGFYMRIYLDGVLSASRQVEGTITQNTNALVIGQQPEYTEYFTGYVDEARVWSRALSQCEIVAKKNCELDVAQQSDLAAYYKFNQGFGDAENTTTTTLLDATANANNGSLQNFALAGLLSNWATYFSADRSGNTCPVYVEPPVAIHPNGTLFGIGSTIKLSGTGSPTIYTWDGPNSFSQEDQVATVYNAQASNSGIYTVTVPMVNCVINKSVRITVANITPLIISGPTTFCPSGSVTFTTPNTGTAYQWYRNDTAINGANTVSYVANQTGNYSVAVTNGANVSVSEVVTVTVEDNLAPVANIASLPTLTIEAPAVVTTVPTATDNCSGTITATTTSPLTYNTAGTYTITWKYDDGHGNISTQTQTVVVTKVVDTDPPVLAVPGNIMLDATACGATAAFTATATDDSGEPVTITYSQQPGTEFPIGVTTVTVTAKDAANNTSTGTFTVTVADHTTPVLTLPADINATSATGINTGTATATDNCGTPVITHSTIPAIFPLGVTNITWTATDAAGNTVSGVQKVTVTDVTAPVLSGVPANTSASCGILPAVPTVTATDDFDQNPVVTMTTATSGNTVTRTWTAKDASGNTSAASQVITLIPAAAPIIAGPVSGSAVTQNPLTAAMDFNVFAKNNVTFGNAQSHGPVAMGGNLTINGSYSVSNNSAGSFKVSNVPVTLVMGGRVNYQGGNSVNVNQSGYVKIGDATGSYVWYKDQNNAYSNIRITPGANYNGNPMINLQTNSQALNVSATNNPVFQSNVIDFSTAFTQLQASATSLSTLADNAALTNPNGASIPHTGLPSQVKINLASGVNVLNVSGSDLNNVQDFTFNNAPDASHILIVNVNAPGTFGWNVYNTGGIGDGNTKYILYNFYNTTALNVQGNGSVMGSLFAPNADINKTTSQNITGQIIGQSLVHTSGTNTYNKFEGTVTSGSTTEIAANSNVVRTANSNNCSYTVNGTEFNATATPADACGTPVLTYTLSGATTGSGSSLAGVTLNTGTTTITWTAANGTATSTYSFTVTVQANTPAAPVVSAVDNCGNTTLTATGSNLIWSTGATTSSITVNTAGSYTVTQSVNGCVSPAATVTAAPKATPAAPVVSAVDNCGNTTLTATGSNLIWSTGATTSSITVNTAGSYTVTQSVNGCVSPAATVTAAPKAAPAAPVVSAVDNCGNTTLTATGSNLVWSTGATTSSITVNTAGSYTVTQSVNGCVSPAATVTAAPKAIPATPVITVVSNCGNSVLSTDASGTLAWSTGASASSITVTDNGTYTVTSAVNGCTSAAGSVNVTIATPVVLSAITGNTTVIAGSTTQLANSTSGGTWSSLNTNIATVNATGLVTGVAAGNATIKYVVTTPQGCTTTVTASVSVNPSCVAPALTSANVVAGTPASAAACSGPVTYTVNATGNTPTLTYTFSGATTGSGSGTGSGSVFNTGVTTVVVKAVNACGTATTTFTVTLKDGTAPVPNVAVLPTITGQCSVSLAATTPSNNNYSGNYSCQYKKSWSCNDDCRCCRYTCHCRRGDCDCDRYSYRSRNVISMILYYIGNYYYGWGDDDDDDDHGCDHDDDSDGGSQVSNAPKATDNCKGTIVGTTTDPLTYNSQGTYTIHWKYDDGNGNVTIQEQTVIVKDDTKPVLNVPGNITVYCGSSLTPSGCNSTATATDNCSSVNITYSDVNNGSTIERTWKATDAAGNYSTGVQIITIKDNTRPTISDVADATVGCSSSTDPSVTGRPTASDACSEVTLTYSDAVNGNVITRTWKATDAAGNYSTSTQRITQGSSFNVNITSMPTNSTYTGGIATNLYLGYGAQSTKLQVGQLPSSGAPYTYSWTGSATSRLNSTSSSAPTFTPTEAGTYTYVVTVTNKYGCSSTDYISICVTDIRVPGTKGKKVYVCHKSGNRWSVSYQTLEVSVNAVPAHLEAHGGCGNNDDDDRLGSCSQSPCGTTSGTFTSTNAPVTQGGVTSEGTTVNSTKETAKSSAVTEEELKVTVMPNPSTTYFTLKFESRNQAPLNLRVMDGTGRVIDAKAKIAPNSTLQIGHNYTSGTYYAEITQGGLRKVVQLIKARG